MCDPKTQIKIDDVKGGSGIGQDLIGCYFQYVEDRNGFLIFKFFDQDGNEIIGKLKAGSQFDFELDGRAWSLNIKACSCDVVKGLWADSGNDWDPDQSYQAQAGGTVEGEETAAAANV